MSRLTASTQPEDNRRALRLLIAWATGDGYAANVVLEEVMDDPGPGTPGLTFSLAEFITDLGLETSGDTWVEGLRRILLHATADNSDHSGDDDR